jgi:hypothetical protein
MVLQKQIHLPCTCYVSPWNIEITSIVQYHVMFLTCLLSVNELCMNEWLI